ncbi:MAG: GNAT family N-acetyltransferase [Sarcina sp.]
MRFIEINKNNIGETINLYVTTFNSEPWNDEWTEEIASRRLVQMLNCEGFYGLICYENNDVVGMILGNHEHYYDGMQFQVKEFCVSNNCHGKGYGSIILDNFIEKLKSKGIDEVILLTSRNEKTEGFYNRRGFESLEDMIMMRKKI